MRASIQKDCMMPVKKKKKRPKQYIGHNKLQMNGSISSEELVTYSAIIVLDWILPVFQISKIVSFFFLQTNSAKWRRNLSKLQQAKNNPCRWNEFGNLCIFFFFFLCKLL